MRSSGNGKHTTIADHMPSSHRRYADWTIGRIRTDAALIGPATQARRLAKRLAELGFSVELQPVATAS